MSWGTSIALAFVAFAAFIGVLVTVCVKQNISLVSKNYYQEELNYQQQINELNNAAALREKPVIASKRKHVEVIFPSGIQAGQLKLQRPDDARFDASMDIEAQTNDFDMVDYPSGRYNASLRWTMNGKTYLVQQPIDL